MRTLRVRADENALPMAPIPKTLHSRNKSSPALSSMAAAAASKSLGIKRTAFGDVSNTSHVNRPIRDDSIIKSKAGYELKENAITFYQDKKPSAILRPAQRPLSVSGLKALLNNVTNTGLSATTKPETQPPPNTRKVLTKRNTTVFRETSEQQLEPAVVDLYKQLPAKPVPAPVHRELNSHTHETHTTEPQPDLRRRESKRAVLSEKLPPADVVVVKDTSSETNVHSDGAFIDDFGNVQVCEYIDETDYAEGSVVKYVTEPISQQEPPRVENVTRLPELIDTSVEKSLPSSLPPQVLPIASEPEEYWDEEEDNDYYEEEGYVTARSYKSRGENTTGGATTILFPKVTNKVRKELAAAKEIVEASRTQDEIEDEAYDMSMVVEYGDEIFSYMKELEVCPF
jgi:G2/mitotic-specific cyclin 3/4